ncbi:Agrin [Aphelenchoides besseyi]|nr:Agrin [Aphelenchoides besseyi]
MRNVIHAKHKYDPFGRECVCERKLKPVCGTDGSTYENMCQFECAKRLRSSISVQYSGSCCASANLCPGHYSPVCDNFGSLHNNECHFEHQKCLARKMYGVALRIADPSKCLEPLPTNDTRPCDFECNQEIDPHCDDRGNTHKNQCLFEQVVCVLQLKKIQTITLVHKGRCNNTKHGKSPQPVYFGTTIQEFEHKDRPSQSGTNDAKLYFHQPDDPFVDQNPYDIFIPATLETTTQRDSSTTPSTTLSFLVNSSLSYSEQLVEQVKLDRAADTSPTQTIVTSTPDFSDGSECSSDSCYKKWDPICDNRNQTHRNMYVGEIQIPICDNANQTHLSACRFAQWNCEHRANGLEERVLVHVGVCRNNSLVFTMDNEVCPTTCSKNYKPVCDSDQITHPNLCTFQKINCIHRKMKRPEAAWLVYLHECRQAKNDFEDKTTDEIEVEPNASIYNTTPTTTTEVSSQSENFVCPDPICPTTDQNPVCDQEGTIHKSECMFTWARCMAAREGRTLHLVSNEECPANKCRLVENRVCSNDYNPICGSDFRTHPNHCFFEKAQCLDEELDVLFKGECNQCLKTPCAVLEPENEPDSLFYCDQNGETKSKCEFEMIRCIYEIRFGYNITWAYEGKCCSTYDKCPLEVEPICDSKGKEHQNRCYFDVANCRAVKIEHIEAAQIVSNSSCDLRNSLHSPRSIISEQSTTSTVSLCNQSISSCTGLYDPVCGTNHITYANECYFYVRTCNEAPTVQIMHRGVCCDREDCTAEFAPLCDSLNDTHLNLCEFVQHRCMHEKMHGVNLSIKAYDACPDDPCISNKCSQTYSPICGTNGKTYINECELKNVNCLRARTSSEIIDVDYMDECCSLESCPLGSQPVCDTENRTHSNICQFKLEKCMRNRRNNQTIELAYNGTCCQVDCSNASRQEICDSTGQTHWSLCDFRIAQCEAERKGQTISIAPQLSQKDGSKLLQTTCTAAQLKSTSSSATTSS